jgi:hypothetical protein
LGALESETDTSVAGVCTEVKLIARLRRFTFIVRSPAGFPQGFILRCQRIIDVCELEVEKAISGIIVERVDVRRRDQYGGGYEGGGEG